MFIIFWGEGLTILIIFLLLCADGCVLQVVRWLGENWGGVEFGVAIFFMAIMLIEIIATAKREKNESLLIWYTIWNFIRSAVAINYVLFIVNDMVANYGGIMGIGEKILFAMGLQLAIIPLFLYGLFEVILSKTEMTYRSVFLAGIVSAVGIVLGALFLLM